MMDNHGTAGSEIRLPRAMAEGLGCGRGGGKERLKSRVGTIVK